MKENALDAVNGTAAASIVAATVCGLTLQEWAAVAALAYTLILIVEKCWRLWRKWRDSRDD